MGLFPEAIPAVLFVWTAVAFALMMTVFHHRRLAAKMPDDQAYYRYFFFFFVMFMAVPVLIVCLGSARPMGFLSAAGFSPGKWRLGLVLAGIGVPIGALSAAIGSRDPRMKEQYPFSKRVCASAGKLAAFETAYLVLYYLPWEFLFRGILFFPLVPALGLVPALAVQAALSTLYHFGHPDSEVFAALGAGFAFGLIAWVTGSFFYTVFIHAFIGVSTDVFLYRRYSRRPARHA
jgi:membrane protease YdiL (CAAX protease family)